jgi:hypothetical protein
MVYRPLPRKREFSGTAQTIWYRFRNKTNTGWESVLRSVEERTPGRHDEATRRCGFYLLGALGPTNSGTPALQGIEIPQHLRRRAVELEIIGREAGYRLQPLEVE